MHERNIFSQRNSGLQFTNIKINRDINIFTAFINNILMRLASTTRKYSNIWRNRTLCMKISEVIHKDIIPKALEDWQYCKLITSELKNNNYHQAVSLLFQSYFNNQVLDIQIYSQLAEKITASTLPLSYAEIMYIIYREDFPPHILMKTWMDKLTQSNNEQLLIKLRKDYQALGEQYPLRKSMKRQTKREVKRQEPNTKSKQKISQMELYKKFIAMQNLQFSQALSQHLQPEDLFRIKLSTQMKDILMQLNINTCDHTDIFVQGVNIEFWKFESNLNEEDNPELPQDEQYEFQNNDHNLYKGLFGLDINKIKIKRLQLYHKKDEW